MNTCQLHLLGEPRLDGAELMLARPKQFGLLTYLTIALPRGLHRREALLPLFWPGASRERARATLRKALHGLRRALPPGSVVTRGKEEVGIDAGVLACDVVTFEADLDEGREEAALELYAGHLLPAFYMQGCGSFESWLESERKRLRRRAARAAWFLAEQVPGDDEAEIVARVQRAIALAPLDEPGVRRGMEILGRVGNPAGAVEVFESFRHRLRLAYDLTPTAASVVLLEQMRTGGIAEVGDRTAAGSTARDRGPAAVAARSEREREPASVGVARGESGADSWPTIAILPLADMSADRGANWFADALTEEITHRVTQTGCARVVARTSAFSFRDSGEDVRQIGQRLGAELVIEGSVRREGERHRITVQLIDATSGNHLWSDSFEGDAQGSLATQDRIALAVARHIAAARPGSPGPSCGLPERAPLDPEAYNAYLKGRFQLSRRTPDSVRLSVEHLRRATVSAPHFAAAHALLASCYAILPVYTDFPSKEALELSRASATRALRLEEQSSDAHAAIGFFSATYEWNWDGAEQAYLRALELDPGNAMARALYALYPLSAVGRRDEAVEQIRRARAEDPLSLSINAYVALVNYFAHRFDDAVTEGETVVELDDTYALGHWVYGLAMQGIGELDRAIRAYQRAAELTRGSPLMRAHLACALAATGSVRRAEEMLASLLRQREDGSVSAWKLPMFAACVFTALDRQHEALEALYQAYREREAHLVFLNVEPRLNPLRGDPRFRRLLLRVGVRAGDGLGDPASAGRVPS